MFYPTDVKYFIQFECEDRQRRAEERAAGGNPKRKIPNAKQYLNEQTKQGLLTEDAIGGLYTPVFLKSFLHSTFPPDLQKAMYEHMRKPKPWHGAPIAAFKRAFAALGSLRIERFKEAIEDLRLLHDLNFLLPENFNVASITPAPSVDRRPDQRPGGFGDDKDPGHPGGNPSKKRGPEPSLGGRGKTGRTGGTGTGKTETGKTGTGKTGTGKTGKEGKQMVQMPSQDPFWTLGPDSTSSICMERFGACLVKRSGAVA
jgi:hypothetical protein